MVRGLEIFKKYFKDYPENYIIIGGTACDIILGEVDYVPRDGIYLKNVVMSK